MSCAELKPLIEGYFDNELDLVRSLEMEKHLETCPGCAEHLTHLRQLRTSLQAAQLHQSAPEHLRQWVLAQASTAKKREFAWTWGWPRMTFWGPLTAAAAVAVVVIGMPSLNRTVTDRRLAQEIVSVHVRSLMAAHLTDVTSTDQHTVKPWFNGKIDFAPWVQDLADYGFPLKGGRLDYVNQRSVATLIYQRHQHFINLLIWPVQDHDRSPVTLTQRGYNLVHWSKAGMTYWAISDLNRHELDQFAQIVQSQSQLPPSL